MYVGIETLCSMLDDPLKSLLILDVSWFTHCFSRLKFHIGGDFGLICLLTNPEIDCD